MGKLTPEIIEVFLNEEQGVLNYLAEPHENPQVKSPRTAFPPPQIVKMHSKGIRGGGDGGGAGRES